MRSFALWLFLVCTAFAQTVDQAEITDTPFSKFLKYKRYTVKIGETVHRGGFVHGPGHHSAAVAALTFDQNGKLYAITKVGDTRFSRAGRGEPYVLDGTIAGRLDKEGEGAVKIALGELAEEVGGEVVPGSFQFLGAPTPTMPLESTECDSYFVATVKLTGRPTGDGGSMEVLDLIGPKFQTPRELLEATRQGRYSDSSRVETMHCRSFDRIGYLPQLDLFVQDHPELFKRYETLGLGEVQELRGGDAFAPYETPSPKSRVNDIVVVESETIALDSDSRMVDARTRHAVRDGDTVEPVGSAFANQYLQLDYDRAKILTYAVHPKLGPLVLMKKQARPALAFAPGKPDVIREDVEDIKIRRDQAIPEGTFRLGSACGASSGQSDLYYHLLAREVEPPAGPEALGYVTLANAMTLCREGQGDSQTEALLIRLADRLEWIPNLGMSMARARKLCSAPTR